MVFLLRTLVDSIFLYSLASLFSLFHTTQMRAYTNCNVILFLVYSSMLGLKKALPRSQNVKSDKQYYNYHSITNIHLKTMQRQTWMLFCYFEIAN